MDNMEQACAAALGSAWDNANGNERFLALAAWKAARPTSGASDLHAAIMGLQPVIPGDVKAGIESVIYTHGFNDCRDAAAELVAASASGASEQKYTRADVQQWRDDVAHAAADMVQRASPSFGTGDWSWLVNGIRALAQNPQPAASVGAQAAGEAVGEAGVMPGTSGFTMACFKAADVPLGTKLYTAPVPAPATVDTDAMTRLRRVLHLLGITDPFPEDDAKLAGVLFSMLGLVARNIEALKATVAHKESVIQELCFATVDSASPATVPEGMVPLRMEWEPGYPEDVAFGSQMQMDRLKKWLDKYFAMIAASASPAVDRDAVLAVLQKSREYVAHYVKTEFFGANCKGDLKALDDTIERISTAQEKP